MTTKLKWKEIYLNNKFRRYSEITKIKQEGVQIESNPSVVAKKKPYIIILISIALIAISLITFRNDLKIALAVIAFLALMGCCFFIFNYYKLECTKDGLYIKYGMQQGVFDYKRIKSIYISRFNDSSYLFSIRTYNIVIRYEDDFKRLRELFFDASFLNKEQVIAFLDNFETTEAEEAKYVNFERYKLIKKIAKILLIIAFVIVIGLWGYFGLNGRSKIIFLGYLPKKSCIEQCLEKSKRKLFLFDFLYKLK